MCTSLSSARKREALAQISMFQNVPPRAIDALEQSSTLVRVRREHTFYFPESSSAMIHILLAGRVHQYRLNPEGKKIVTAILQPQAVFDAESLLQDGVHHHFASAIEPCTVLLVPRADLRRLTLAHPQMLLYMLEQTHAHLHAVEEKLESVAFRRIAGRVAEFLLQLAEQQGDQRVIGYTHQEIADCIGTYRETVTQTLNQFKAMGCIAIGRKSIDILNSRQLAATMG